MDRPAPMTPSDCDLSDFAFMPLDVARLRDSELAANETPEACWAAVLLWSASWHQIPAASIPNDDKWIAINSGAGVGWRKIKKVVLCDWILCSDGRLYHPVVAEKALVAWEKKQATGRKINRRLQIESAEWAALRASIFERDNYTCRYCLKSGVRLEADHVTPVRHGGKTDAGNLVTACRSCNRSKGSKTLAEWKA